ncbi:MAG: hypothetical protein Q7Q71_04960 [Verrucomicrobiota bacterium JB023]|nr:hypothetical protein [Verrucomicrobiota bacterium JB023]
MSEPPQEKKAEPQASSQPTGSPFEQGQGASVAQVAASVGSAAPLQAATASPAPAENSSSRGRTRQLELRAIFGVEGEMSREEILKRAKNLPGIRDLAVVGAGEMSALGTLGGVMSRFGYGDSNSWQLTCPGGIVDFVSNENTTLAVMREGRYSAGVWETLMIVARELGQAS